MTDMHISGSASSEGFASVGLFSSLASYLELGIGTVEGWLSPTSASILAQLLVEQVRAGLRGDTCEIGVHHGRLFIVLANAQAPGERAIAVDVFGDQEKNVDRSGQGDRAVFERNLRRYAPAATVEIVQESSLDLERLGFLSHRFRFVSVDGGHTGPTVANDLRLAERTLLGNGVVALDDILSSHWTGVLTGLAAYVGAGGTLVPFALVPNKLLLTTGQAAADQGRALLRRLFPLALAKPDLEFLNGTVDSYADHPHYDRENCGNLHAALDALRGERDALASQLNQVREQAARLQGAHDALATRLAAAEAHAARLQASTSWRVTEPLRSIAGLARSRSKS